jgi:hypothetical protein
LYHDKWNTNLEIPFADFVAEGEHGEIDAEATVGSGKKEKNTFGDAVVGVVVGASVFVDEHDCESCHVGKDK